MFAVHSIKGFQGSEVHQVINAQVVKILSRRRCKLINEYNRKGGNGALETGYMVGSCVMNLLNGLTTTGGSFGSPAHSGRKWGSIAQTKRGNVLTGI